MLFNTFTTPVLFGGVTGFNQLKKDQESQQEVLKANAFVSRETEYFKENIGKVSSAEEFVEDTRLLRYGLAAYGLEEELFKTAFIQNILESDLTDPRSAASRVGDPRWQSFTKAFVKVTTDLPGPLQDGFGDRQISNVYSTELERYKTDAQIETIKSDAEKFRTIMKDITRAEDLVKLENRDALNFIKQAFGVENDASSDVEIVEYLTSPNFSASPPEGWQEARTVLNFFDETLIDPTVTDTKPNSGEVIEEVIKLRFENELADESGAAAYKQEGENFRDVLRNLTGPDDIDTLLADEKTMNYLKSAFNLDNDTTDNGTIKSYLTASDDTDIPRGWSDIRELLNFHEVTEETPYEAPSFTRLSQIIDQHEENEIRVGSNIERFKRLKAEADDFRINIGLVASNEDLVANTKLLRFAMRSSGISTSAIDSKKMLNVLNNEYSFNPNLESDKRLQNFQKDFSFTISNNTLKTLEDGFADKIEESFLEQTFITAVGNSDPDLRLAFYFENRIQDLASEGTVDENGWLKILGEQPMATAFQRVLGLPQSIGTMDIDQQVEVYQRRSESVLGSSDLSRFGDKEYRDEFLNLFLTRSSGAGGGFNSSSQSIALSILRGGV